MSKLRTSPITNVNVLFQKYINGEDFYSKKKLLTNNKMEDVQTINDNLNENNNEDKRKGKYFRKVLNDFCQSMNGSDVGFMNISLYMLFAPYLIYRLLIDKTIPCLMSCFVLILIIYATNTSQQ